LNYKTPESISLVDHADRDGGSLLNFLARKYHESSKEILEGGIW